MRCVSDGAAPALAGIPGPCPRCALPTRPALAGEPLPRHIKSVIERCWQAITAAARTLADAGEIGHGDVCAALGIPSGENSLERAAILSGSAPGSFTLTRPVEKARE